MTQVSSRRAHPTLIALAVAAACALAFAPALSGSWLYDDHALVEHNANVHGFARWSHWFTASFWDTGEDYAQAGSEVAYWRPAISASYALDWTISGGDPAFFHAMNVVWHALAGALGFLVLRRWLGGTRAAALAALLVLVHPTKAESVAWIAGRTDVLCLVALLIATQGIARRLRGARGGLAIEIAGTALAYACKEHAIVLPMFAAIEAWVAADRPPLTRATASALAKAAAPQLAVAIAYLVTRALAMPIDIASGSDLGPLLHAEVVLETLGRFFALTFAPHDLSAQHALVHTIHGALVVSPGYIALGAAGLVGLVAVAVAARRRLPGVTLGIAFYLLALLPTANLRFTHLATLVSDRFLYLPLLGIGLGVGAVLEGAAPASRRSLTLLAAAVALAFGMLSLARAVDYRDESAFWERERRLHPDSEVARHYALEEAVAANHYREALGVLAEIQRIYDTYDHTARVDVETAYLLASIGSRLVRDRDGATLDRFDTFVRTLLEPDQPRAVLATPIASFAIDTRRSDYAAAVATFAPRLLVLRALLASRRGDDAAAIALAARAGALCPRCSTIRGPELEILAGAGSYDQADALAASLRDAADAALLAPALAEIAAARRAHQRGADGAAFAALGLWGRAYAALAPHRDAPELAEYAFKAGDEAAARALLAAAPDRDARMAAWTESMGWAVAPALER